MTDAAAERVNGKTFDEWKRDVNRVMVRWSGLSADDQPDADYWEMWHSGMSPRECAADVLDANGFDGPTDLD